MLMQIYFPSVEWIYLAENWSHGYCWAIKWHFFNYSDYKHDLEWLSVNREWNDTELSNFILT
jgi:hypothetical protein